MPRLIRYPPRARSRPETNSRKPRAGSFVTIVHCGMPMLIGYAFALLASASLGLTGVLVRRGVLVGSPANRPLQIPSPPGRGLG